MFIQRRIISFFSGISILIVVCFLSNPAYSWFSVDGGTHFEINEAAYKKLTKEENFNSGRFPYIRRVLENVESIHDYTGIKKGADAEKDSEGAYNKYSYHYYNPSTTEGRAPEQAKKYYDILVGEIKAKRPRSSKAAQAAAFLGHYVADIRVPYHVKGGEADKPSPEHKDWSDEDYHEIAGKLPAGPHPGWELSANGFSPEEYKSYSGISPEWIVGEPGSTQISDFVKKIAKDTEYAAKHSNIQSESVMKDLLGRSVQDVFTVYKAAYDEATYANPRTVKVINLGNVVYTEAPKTFKLNEVLNDDNMLEVAVYPYGRDVTYKYGGWNGWLEVNGKRIWDFKRFEKGTGGIIYDYTAGREVLENLGKGSYCDVTHAAKPEGNEITYYHYGNSGGPGMGVKVRIQTKEKYVPPERDERDNVQF